jgi:transposase
MDANLFWFNDEQWAKIVPRLPSNQPGPNRKNDRRILSDHACAQDRLPPPELPQYAPHKIIYNRFSRWSERGAWQKIFECVAGPCGPPEQVALDSSHVKIHRCANGAKGGLILRRSGRQKASAAARSTCWSTNFAAPGRSSSRQKTLLIA